MNCIIKNGNNFRLEEPKNIDTLSYEARNNLVRDIKLFTGYTYGYVDKLGRIIPVKSYNELRLNLGIGGMFNLGTLLVIQ